MRQVAEDRNIASIELNKVGYAFYMLTLTERKKQWPDIVLVLGEWGQIITASLIKRKKTKRVSIKIRSMDGAINIFATGSWK